MHKFFAFLNLLLILVTFNQCNQPVTNQPKVNVERVVPKIVGYHFELSKEWMKLHSTDSLQQKIVWAVNRTDAKHLATMDSIIEPDDYSGDIAYYLPFPMSVPALGAIKKILFFSYLSQSFAAYEMGELIYAGPVNMGRKKDPTPIRLYFTNWKAEKTTSTFNDEWELKWNFNIENKLGIGFHQYDLPGYPASHSCLRLLEKDAVFLYNWADQWVMDEKIKDSISAKGTPVIVFGTYPFDAPKPWMQLIDNPNALDISPADIQKEVVPYLNDIIAEQQKNTNSTGKIK